MAETATGINQCSATLLTGKRCRRHGWFFQGEAYWGDCFGLRVFLEILESACSGRIKKVVTMDCHSPQAALEYGHSNNQQILVDIPPEQEICTAIHKFGRAAGSEEITVLFPDKGARDRYTDIVPGEVGNNHGVIRVAGIRHCSKIREPKTGKLSGFDVPTLPTKQALIIDDICDGGGTFVGIADALKSQEPVLGLYVTHGIFSQGFTNLVSRFKHIYTTDTFREPANSQYVETFPVINRLLGYKKEDKHASSSK